MSRKRYEDDDDDWNESNFDCENEDDFDSEPTRECPYCHFEMLEICVQCPSCGQYTSEEDSHQSSRPRWVVFSAVLCLAVLLFWFLVGL